MKLKLNFKLPKNERDTDSNSLAGNDDDDLRKVF